MFKQFTNASEMLDFIKFPKWKKSHNKFNYGLFLERGDYPRKSLLMNITFVLFMCLMVSGAIGAMVGISKGSSSFSTILPLIFLTLIAIRFVTPVVMNIIDFFTWRAYARKFNAFMNEARLVEFVDFISQDIHATYKLKNKNNYKELILAYHHQDKNFVKIAYKIMDEFYTYKEEQLKKSYNESIVTNFLNKEVHKNSQLPCSLLKKQKINFNSWGN